MNFLDLQPILIPDENIVFPLCHVCQSECSPFLITNKETLERFLPLRTKRPELFRVTYDRQMVVFICKKCVPREITK